MGAVHIMKLRACLLLSLVLPWLCVSDVRAQDAAAELKALVSQVQAKLGAGQRSASELAPELAAFDALVAKYQEEKSEDAAQIALMRATLYIQVLNDPERGNALLAQIKTDYPDTKAAASVERFLEAQSQQARTKEAQRAIVGQPAPELNFKWSSGEGLDALSDLKGKVVVLDFWATWCGPCISSFPQVRELVEHYQGSDVVVIGVTSLQGRVMNLEAGPINTRGDPEKEYSLMSAFMKAKDMTWTVAFSEQPVFNPQYGVAGIPHMTIVAPDGTVRHNDLHPAMPHAQKVEKIDALLKEFRLPLPAKKSA